MQLEVDLGRPFDAVEGEEHEIQITFLCFCAMPRASGIVLGSFVASLMRRPEQRFMGKPLRPSFMFPRKIQEKSSIEAFPWSFHIDLAHYRNLAFSWPGKGEDAL